MYYYMSILETKVKDEKLKQNIVFNYLYPALKWRTTFVPALERVAVVEVALLSVPQVTMLLLRYM